MVPIVAGLLMGAALGGGIAALQKKDVLQGALMGGIGGALGGAFMPAAGGLGGVAEGTAAGLAEGATTSGIGALTGGAESVASNALSGTLANQTATQGLNTAYNVGAVDPSIIEAGTGGFHGAAMEGGALGIKPTVLTNQPFSIGNFLSQNKGALAGGVLGGMMAPGEEPDKPDEGNIRDFTFKRSVNPLFGQRGQSYFNDAYEEGDVTPVSDYNKADGGIIGLADGGMPQDYRVAEFKPVAVQDFSAVRPVAPAVQAYNRQIMDLANQQYNINPRPAAMQVPGSVGYGAYNPLPIVASKPADAGIGGLRFDPVTGRYIGDFKSPSDSKEKTELEKMREEIEAMRGTMPNQDLGGGAANGGLMQSYAMGGEIGGRYASPDDMTIGDRVGAHQTVNMAPHYPMQGLYQGYAEGGHLGDYSDGGRLLKGPGDGVSDDIPAQIGLDD